ncbi:MAG: hypothetical protein ABI718_11260 [Acidobacteriota bacterium]
MTVVPGYIRMKPNTAPAFMAASIALLAKFAGAPSRIRRIAALVPLVIGAGTMFQYVTGLSLHLDQMFFDDPVQKIYPGRMAHLTAINFVLLGLALLWRTKRVSIERKRLGDTIALLVAISSLLAIVGYLYGVPLLYGSIKHTAMAFHTGLSFLLLSLAVVFIDPRGAVASLFWSRKAGGVVARRLLPAAILIPIGLGRVFVSDTFDFNNLRMGMELEVVA